MAKFQTSVADDDSGKQIAGSGPDVCIFLTFIAR